MRIRSLVTAAATLALAAGLFAAPVSAGGTALVSVVHGIPGATVDVCVGSTPVRENVRYGRHFQAPLPEGTYPIRVRRAGPGACTGPIVLRQSVSVVAGQNTTVIAVVKSGAAKLETYVNDLSVIGLPGQATVSAIHAARAPEVDLWIASPLSLNVGPEPTLADVARGDLRGPVPLYVDAYAVWASRAGTVAPVIGPVVAELAPNRAYSFVAIGTKPANYRIVTLDLGPLPVVG